MKWSFHDLLSMSIALECAFGKYGLNCSSVCGHCSDLSDCVHIDGTCQNGCQSGYQGRLCKDGIL